MIKIYELRVNLVKVKAHDNNEYNINVDKLVKLDADKKELLELIDWKISLKLNTIEQQFTLFEDYYLQSFRIKICCNELPTCANLKKRKPDLYDDSWKCNFCEVVRQDKRYCTLIIKRFKNFLVNIISDTSKEEIDHSLLLNRVEELKMWDFTRSLYNFTFLLKNQISFQLISLLKLY
ncbi:hypothetical protein C1646_773959 [Rhizophagus diaphanus]|nr:hypothetical protein C1646_773959 [Rhizophagus diaphanus] [Rhizophagus sp. MUCL 43196]